MSCADPECKVQEFRSRIASLSRLLIDVQWRRFNQSFRRQSSQFTVELLSRAAFIEENQKLGCVLREGFSWNVTDDWYLSAFAVSIAEKTELFLELFGNLQVRAQSLEYVERVSTEFIR